MLAQTVTSVGPYALTTRRSRAHTAASPGGHASPATTTVATDPGSPPSRLASTDGGTVRCVTRPAATVSASDPAGGS